MVLMSAAQSIAQSRVLSKGGPLRVSWREFAACRGMNPDTFFPVGEKVAADLEQIAFAKSVCEVCPVRQPCLDYAITYRQDYGIWGGFTETEVRRIRRARQRRGAA